jgi:hypothetical protein
VAPTTSSTPPVPVGAHPTASGRIRACPIQAEDLALFGALVFLEPLVDRWLGDAMGGVRLGGFDAGAPGAGLASSVLLLAALGAALCVVTRVAGEPAARFADDVKGLGGYGRFLVMVVICMFVALGLEGFGIQTGEGLFFLGIIALSLPLAFYPRLPALAAPLRRLLMMPAVLIGASLFTREVGVLLGDGEVLRALPAPDDPMFGFALFLLSLVVFGTLAFYVLLVAAPRVVAGAGGGVLWWGLRFGVFLAAVALNLKLPF